MRDRLAVLALACDVADGPCWEPWCPACRNLGVRLCPDCGGTGQHRTKPLTKCGACDGCGVGCGLDAKPLTKCGACDGCGVGCGLDSEPCDGTTRVLPVTATARGVEIPCWVRTTTGGRCMRNPTVVEDEIYSVTEACLPRWAASPIGPAEPCASGPVELDDAGYWSDLEARYAYGEWA